MSNILNVNVYTDIDGDRLAAFSAENGDILADLKDGMLIVRQIRPDNTVDSYFWPSQRVSFEIVETLPEQAPQPLPAPVLPEGREV
jgi:hypothetical protein